MCSLACYAFLRVGEMAATNNNKSPLSIDNITKLVNAANHVVSPKVTHSCITSTATTSPLFCDHTTSVFFLPRPIYARLLEITRQFSRPPFRYRLIDSIFAACLPLLLSVAVLTRHATKVIVFESELLLMQLRGECLRFVLGRGNSNAFLRYIQISSLSSTN